ncbi:MAG: glycosyltransferase family 4 protein [Candidatus Woesearchaeota archaeon]|nr:MAG: glycosyltransferase family 4 protein [Candidatus Woesearchaeota archaeon]
MTKKLSILNVGPTPPRLGGSAFVNIETMIHLAERGHHVRAISQLSASQLASPDHDRSWRGTGVEVFPIEAEFQPSSKPLSRKELKDKADLIQSQFMQLVREERPDIVMVGHESQSFYVNEFARKMGIPVLQVLHGTPTHLIDRGVFPPWLSERFMKAVGAATIVIGVSKYLANIVRGYGILQTAHIYNGTDTKLFAPRDTKDPEFLASIGASLTDKVIMHASNLKSIKRPLDIIYSAAIALDSDPSLRYVFVGDGPLRAEMEEVAEQLDISSRVSFVGKTTYEKMPEFFQHAEVFILSSEQEGFGRVIREAQACRTVPLASNIGPMGEVIDHGRTGVLYEKGNVHALAAETLALTRNEERRRHMGTQARLVAEAYDIAAMVADYESALSAPHDFLKQKTL